MLEGSHIKVEFSEASKYWNAFSLHIVQKITYKTYETYKTYDMV